MSNQDKPLVVRLIELLSELANPTLYRERNRHSISAVSQRSFSSDPAEEKRTADREATRDQKRRPPKGQKAGEVFSKRGYDYQWIEKNEKYQLYRLQNPGAAITETQVRAQEDQEKVAQKYQKSRRALRRSNRAETSGVVRPAPRQPGQGKQNARSMESYRAAGVARQAQAQTQATKNLSGIATGTR